MNKFISLEQALGLVKDGMTIMVGGFLANGTPKRIIDALAASSVRNLTVITNDAGYPDRGVGQLIANRQVKKLYTSYIGSNPVAGELLNSKELEVEFCPQGTFVERIRCGGNGLGGFLTPTGLGTLAAEGKQIITVDGRDFVLETPLRADIAFIGASVGDEMGNLIYHGTSQNFNPLMATASDTVVVELGERVATGSLAPETIHTPGNFIDFIIS